jgi:hypothetical protein
VRVYVCVYVSIPLHTNTHTNHEDFFGDFLHAFIGFLNQVLAAPRRLHSVPLHIYSHTLHGDISTLDPKPYNHTHTHTHTHTHRERERERERESFFSFLMRWVHPDAALGPADISVPIYGPIHVCMCIHTVVKSDH